MIRKAKLAAIVVAALQGGGAAQAGTREDVLSNAVRCGAIADDRTWLDCFYGSAQPMRRQLNLPPAPAAQTNLVPAMAPGSTPVPPPAASASGPQSDGFWDRMLGGKPILNRIAASSYSFDRQGYFTITLANGQVWRQQDDDHMARWKKPAAQYLVTITQGALGSFNLSVPDDADLYKVRRLR